MATHKKLIPTYIKKEQDGRIKYIPAYKLCKDSEPIKVCTGEEQELFDTPQEALNYLN